MTQLQRRYQAIRFELTNTTVDAHPSLVKSNRGARLAEWERLVMGETDRVSLGAMSDLTQKHL
ncbi:hypothetical protein BN903_41 [Halorubrum sp. AJ67]|nr:hypothetical protein BN903_41 [Halorubrum sp. AJ67]